MLWASGCRNGRAATRHTVEGQAGGLSYFEITARAPEREGLVLVLLHGYGSRPETWFALPEAAPFAAGTRFFFPRAPEHTQPPEGPADGRAWWRLDLASFQRATKQGPISDLSHASPAGLVQARQQVIAFLDELGRRGLDSRRLVLGGFSQGAIVAMDVALHDPRPLAGVMLLSGTLVNEDEWRAHLPARKGLPVLLAHSPEDDVLPYVLADRLRGELQSAGWRVTWLSFAGGHQLTAPVAQAISGFAAAVAR